MALSKNFIPCIIRCIGRNSSYWFGCGQHLLVWPWVMNQLDATALANGFEKLASVGSGIGKFFGSILGGFSEGTLEGAGRGLASLCESLEDIKPRVHKCN